MKLKFDCSENISAKNCSQVLNNISVANIASDNSRYAFAKYTHFTDGNSSKSDKAFCNMAFCNQADISDMFIQASVMTTKASRNFGESRIAGSLTHIQNSAITKDNQVQFESKVVTEHTELTKDVKTMTIDDINMLNANNKYEFSDFNNNLNSITTKVCDIDYTALKKCLETCVQTQNGTFDVKVADIQKHMYIAE